MKHVDLIADGACLAARGPGGWACILRYKQYERVRSGGAPVTTSNQMELRAVTMGLRALQEPCDVSVFTDSKYVEEGMGRLLPQWKVKTVAEQPGPTASEPKALARTGVRRDPASDSMLLG